jgi:hypothetical protein
VSVIEVLDDLRSSRATISREGNQLHLRALFDEHPLSSELVLRCRSEKAELLDYLDFVAVADELLLASTRKIAARWVRSQELDDDVWRNLEDQLHSAYWSQDLDAVRAVLAQREDYAFRLFQAGLVPPEILDSTQPETAK